MRHFYITEKEDVVVSRDTTTEYGYEIPYINDDVLTFVYKGVPLYDIAKAYHIQFANWAKYKDTTITEAVRDILKESGYDLPYAYIKTDVLWRSSYKCYSGLNISCIYGGNGGCCNILKDFTIPKSIVIRENRKDLDIFRKKILTEGYISFDKKLWDKRYKELYNS